MNSISTTTIPFLCKQQTQKNAIVNGLNIFCRTIVDSFYFQSTKKALDSKYCEFIHMQYVKHYNRLCISLFG